MTISRWTYTVFSWLIVAGIGGCLPQGEITQYTIPKEEAIQLPLPDSLAAARAAEAGSATEGRPERMLGAMIPQGEQVWFFKLTGPVEAVAQHAEEFPRFIETVRFSSRNEPEWTLPEGWQQQPGSGMRFSTVLIGKDPPLELTVIALPGGGADLTEQTLANVNRWRGQLSLAPIDLAQLGKDTTTVSTADGISATLVDYTGTSSGGGMMNAPFAGGAAGGGLKNPLAPAAGNTPSDAEVAIKYERPEGWRDGRVGGMRKAALEIIDGDLKAEVTIIDLPEGAGDRLNNVNRWRGQVGLPPVTSAELAQSMTTIAIGELSGDFVELVGDPQAAKPQTILGAIVDHGGKAWFVKLQGDTPLALAEKKKFEAFVASVRFE